MIVMAKKWGYQPKVCGCRPIIDLFYMMRIFSGLMSLWVRLYEIEVGQDEYMIRLLSRQYISFNMWFTPFKYWYSILTHVFCPWPTSFLEKHNLVWNSWIILLELLLTVSFEAWVCRIQENNFCPFVCSLTFGLVKICHFHARQWYDAPHLLSLLPPQDILVQAFIMSKDMKIVETTAWSVTVCFWK